MTQRPRQPFQTASEAAGSVGGAPPHAKGVTRLPQLSAPPSAARAHTIPGLGYPSWRENTFGVVGRVAAAGATFYFHLWRDSASEGGGGRGETLPVGRTACGGTHSRGPGTAAPGRPARGYTGRCSRHRRLFPPALPTRDLPSSSPQRHPRPRCCFPWRANQTASWRCCFPYWSWRCCCYGWSPWRCWSGGVNLAPPTSG